MQFGRARSPNPQFGDSFRADFLMITKYFFERVDGRVIAAAARVRLETDVECLESFSQPVGEVEEIRLVDESGAEAAVRRL